MRPVSAVYMRTYTYMYTYVYMYVRMYVWSIVRLRGNALLKNHAFVLEWATTLASTDCSSARTQDQAVNALPLCASCCGLCLISACFCSVGITLFHAFDTCVRNMMIFETGSKI